VRPFADESIESRSGGSSLGGFLLRSTMAKAVTYRLAQWRALKVYFKDPEIEIDMNLVENVVRPTAIGKADLRFSCEHSIDVKLP
jgi:hypothetical protein